MELLSMVGLLQAILIENPPQLSRELPAVLQVLMPLLHSPLASPRVKQVFLDIGLCLMPGHLHHLGTCTLYVFHKHSGSCFTLSCFSFSSCACWARYIAVAETCMWSRWGLGAGGPGNCCATHHTTPAQPHRPTEGGQNKWWADGIKLYLFSRK